MKENVRYVNAALYESLSTDSARSAARTQPSDFPQRAIAESLLYQEARLLDGGRYEEWMELLTEDCLYWMPAEREPGDPRDEASVNFDDRRRLLDRIALIRSGYLHAQTPPSRTCRMIGNVETWDGREGALEVRSCLTLWSFRRGEMTVFAGAQEHLLAPVADAWRIKRKVIRLLDCDQPLGNISFIV